MLRNDTTQHEPQGLQRLAVPRKFDAGGVTFFLSREGALRLDERERRRPGVKLTPDEAFALLTFVPLPGMVELIEQAEAARQEQQWRDYELDPETIAEQDAGRQHCDRSTWRHWCMLGASFVPFQ